MDMSIVYILLGLLIGVFTLILLAVSIYFLVVYKKSKSAKKKRHRRAQNKQSESAAGNYFQAGTFRLPGQRNPRDPEYDNPGLEEGLDDDEDVTETNVAQTWTENRYHPSRDLDEFSDKASVESDKDSGKGTASVGDSEAAISEHDVINDVTLNDVANDDDVMIDNSGIANVDEVGVDIERTADPGFVSREKEKIKQRAEGASVAPSRGSGTPSRGYAPRYRRRTEPLEPLFETGEDEEERRKASFKVAKDIFNQ